MCEDLYAIFSFPKVCPLGMHLKLSCRSVGDIPVSYIHQCFYRKMEIRRQFRTLDYWASLIIAQIPRRLVAPGNRCMYDSKAYSQPCSSRNYHIVYRYLSNHRTSTSSPPETERYDFNYTTKLIFAAQPLNHTPHQPTPIPIPISRQPFLSILHYPFA